MSAVLHQAFPACCISAVISVLHPRCPPAGPGFYTNVPVFQQSLSFPRAEDEVVSYCLDWQRWVHTCSF